MKKFLLLMAFLLPALIPLHADTYELVDGTNVTFEKGGVYIIVSGNSGSVYALGQPNAASSSYFKRSEAITVENGTITTTNASVFPVEIVDPFSAATSGTPEYAMKFVTPDNSTYNGKYLYANTNANNGCGYTATAVAGCDFTFVQNSSTNKFTITSAAYSTRMLQYNGSSSRYSIYESKSNMADVYLYKRVVAGPAQLAAPTITCSDNDVVTLERTGNATIDNSNIVYRIGDSGAFGDYNDPFSITRPCTVEAKCVSTKEGSFTDSNVASATFNEKQTYQLVISASEIKAGGTYILVNSKTVGSASSITSSIKTDGAVVTITNVGGKLQVELEGNSSVMPIDIVKNNDLYYLQTPDGKYLQRSSSTTIGKGQNYPDDGKVTWKMNDDGAVVFTFTNTTRYLMFTSSDIKAYSSASQSGASMPYLYKLVEEGDDEPEPTYNYYVRGAFSVEGDNKDVWTDNLLSGPDAQGFYTSSPVTVSKDGAQFGVSVRTGTDESSQIDNGCWGLNPSVKLYTSDASVTLSNTAGESKPTVGEGTWTFAYNPGSHVLKITGTSNYKYYINGQWTGTWADYQMTDPDNDGIYTYENLEVTNTDYAPFGVSQRNSSNSQLSDGWWAGDLGAVSTSGTELTLSNSAGEDKPTLAPGVWNFAYNPATGQLTITGTPHIIGEPSISVTDNAVTITAAAGTPDDATIEWSWDNTNWTNYATEHPTVAAANQTLYVKVSKDGWVSGSKSFANVEYTAPVTYDDVIIVAHFVDVDNDYAPHYYAMKNCDLSNGQLAPIEVIYDTASGKYQVYDTDIDNVKWVKSSDGYISVTTGENTNYLRPNNSNTNLVLNTIKAGVWTLQTGGYLAADSSHALLYYHNSGKGRFKNYAKGNATASDYAIAEIVTNYEVISKPIDYTFNFSAGEDGNLVKSDGTPYTVTNSDDASNYTFKANHVEFAPGVRISSATTPKFGTSNGGSLNINKNNTLTFSAEEGYIITGIELGLVGTDSYIADSDGLGGTTQVFKTSWDATDFGENATSVVLYSYTGTSGGQTQLKGIVVTTEAKTWLAAPADADITINEDNLVTIVPVAGTPDGAVYFSFESADGPWIQYNSATPEQRTLTADGTIYIKVEAEGYVGASTQKALTITSYAKPAAPVFTIGDTDYSADAEVVSLNNADIEVNSAVGTTIVITASPAANAIFLDENSEDYEQGTGNYVMIGITDTVTLTAKAVKNGLESDPIVMTLNVPQTVIPEGGLEFYSVVMDGKTETSETLLTSNSYIIDYNKSHESFRVDNYTGFNLVITADPMPQIPDGTYYADFKVIENHNSGADGAHLHTNIPTTFTIQAKEEGKTPSDPILFTITAPLLSQPSITTSGGGNQVTVGSDRVTITAADGAEIWYTLDGTTPAKDSYGTKYTGPFTINDFGTGTVTVTAIAYKDGYRDSNTKTVAITLVAAGTPDTEDVGVVYRLVTKASDIVTDDGHNEYILVQQYANPAVASDALVMGNGEGTRPGLTGFCTVNAEGNLTITRSIPHLRIEAVPETTDQYYMKVSDGDTYKYIGWTTEGAQFAYYDAADANCAMTIIPAMGNKYHNEESVKVPVIRTQFPNSIGQQYATAGYGVGLNGDVFSVYAYNSIFKANSTSSYSWPSLYRRVEANEPVRPGDIIVKLDGVVTTETAFDPMSPTSTLTVTLNDSKVDANDDLALTLVAEPADGAVISAVDGEEFTYDITFVKEGITGITATATRSDYAGNPLKREVTLVGEVHSVYEPMLVVKHATDPSLDELVENRRTEVDKDQVVAITNLDPNATLTYTYTIIGTTGTTTGTLAYNATHSITVSNTVSLNVKVQRDGYLPFEADYIFLPATKSSATLTYTNFVPKPTQVTSSAYQAPLPLTVNEVEYFGKVYTTTSGNDDVHKKEYIQINKDKGYIIANPTNSTLSGLSINWDDAQTSTVTARVIGSKTAFDSSFTPAANATAFNTWLAENASTVKQIGFATWSADLPTLEGMTSDNKYSEVTLSDADEYPYILIWTTSAAYLNGVTFKWVTAPDAAARRPQLYVDLGTDTEETTDDLVEGTDYTVSGSDMIFHTAPINVKIAANAKTPEQSVNYSANGGLAWSEAGPYTQAQQPVTVAVSAPTTIMAQAYAIGLDDSPIVSLPILFAPHKPTSDVQFSNTTDSTTGVITQSADLTLSCTTPGAKIYYMLDTETEWTEYTAPLHFTTPGTTGYSFKAVSEAWGTESEVVVENFTISDPTTNKPFVLLTTEASLNVGSEIIIVSPNNDNTQALAMAPWNSSNNQFRPAKVKDKDGNDTNENLWFDITSANNDSLINLSLSQKDVEILRLAKDGANWLLKTTVSDGSNVGGYVYAATSGNNHMKVSAIPPTESELELAKASISFVNGKSKITFVNRTTYNTIQYNRSSPGYFSAYSDGGQSPVKIYYRGDPAARVDRPQPKDALENGNPLNEGYFTDDEILGRKVYLTCPTVAPDGYHLDIYYTTDGSAPFNENGVATGRKYNGEGIAINDGLVLRAFAELQPNEGSTATSLYLPSYELICAYHVYDADKQYRRVLPSELQTLREGDEVIVVASPTGVDKSYALGREQITLGTELHRAAVTVPSPDAAGIITPANSEVQPLILISGVNDRYPGYNWRLYASGTYYDGNEGNYTDGYLYSAGDNHSLITQRIVNPDDYLMANADMNLLSLAEDGIGNEYGGVTVKFGSPDGHEDTYPNHLGLCKDHSQWSFGTYTLEEVQDDEVHDLANFVSLYRFYDPSKMLMPVFNYSSGTIGSNWDLKLSTTETAAYMYYYIGNDAPTESTVWTEYTGKPIDFDSASSFTIWAYSVDPYGIKTDSDINCQTYNVDEFEVFELVTTGTELREHDRFIIVNNRPYPDFAPTGYYTMTYESYSNNHMKAFEVKEMKTEPGTPTQLLVPTDPANKIVVFTIEPAASETEIADDDPYRWMLRVQHPDNRATIDGVANPTYNQIVSTYLTANGERNIIYGYDLPAVSERRKINASVSVVDAICEGAYPGDYLYFKGHDDSPDGKVTKQTMGSVFNKAALAFRGKETDPTTHELVDVLYTIRFQPDGNHLHFNNYHYTEMEIKENDVVVGTYNQPNASTYPISIYRAASVLPPSMTIYEKDLSDANKYDMTKYGSIGVASGIHTFNNPVKIVIKSNPRSVDEAQMTYAWSKTASLAPVASEYRQFGSDVNTIEIYLDGFKAHSPQVESDALTDLLGAGFSNNTEWLETALRAMAFNVDEDNEISYSRSVLRNIDFKTLPPKLQRSGNDGVIVSRPNDYTLGAVVVYTTDGTEPSVTYGPNGEVIPYNGEIIPVDDDPSTTDVVENLITIPEGSKEIRVGAFKQGYRPSFNEFKQYSFYPTGSALQMLNVTAAGRADVKALVEATLQARVNDAEITFTADDKAAYLAEFDAAPTIYLTYNSEGATAHALGHYAGWYTGTGDDRIMRIVHVDDAAIVANVIDVPGKAKWSADYYVVAMVEEEFKAQVNGSDWTDTENNRYRNLEVTVSDPANPDVKALRSPVYNSAGQVTHLYGRIIERKGSLGLNYVGARIRYDIPAEEGDDEHYDTDITTRILPNMPLPKNLSHYYTASRDNTDDYIVTQDVEVETTSSVPGHNGDVVPMKIKANDFTLRHFDCHFTFERPDVTDDIVDHYDIVYDVKVSSNDSEVPDLKALYQDPLRSHEEDYKGNYHFSVNNVYPKNNFNPSLTISRVYYIPNGEDDGYAMLEANYPATIPSVGYFKQSNEAVNAVTAEYSQYHEFTYGYFKPGDRVSGERHLDDSHYMWAITGHSDLVNPNVNLNKTTETILGAPFMYHLETYSDDDYYSHEYFIVHDAEGGHSDKNPDPFDLLPISNPLTRAQMGFETDDPSETLTAKKSNYPTIILTPIFLFARDMDASVTEEGALEPYQGTTLKPGQPKEPAPVKKVRRRAGGSGDGTSPETEYTAPNGTKYIVVRGQALNGFRPNLSDDSIVTGVENVASDSGEVMYFNLQGIRIENPTPGIYIKVEGNHSEKVVVK